MPPIDEPQAIVAGALCLLSMAAVLFILALALAAMSARRHRGRVQARPAITRTAEDYPPPGGPALDEVWNAFNATAARADETGC